MAKEVTVLSLEGKSLRGLRLAESGGSFSRQVAEAWALDAEAGGEAADGSGEGGASPADATQDRAPAAQDAQELVPPEGGEDAADASASDADILAQAIHEAAAAFKTREFILSMPLSRLLVKVISVPVDERDDIEEVAQDEIKKIAPFPDETLVVGVETVAETDSEIVAVAAALPEAAAADLTAALSAAKVNVTRTDITALGRLRAFWPQICEKEGASRRLVLMNLDGGWDVMVLDDGAPVFLRGLGEEERTPEVLARDVTLSLLQGETFGGTRPIEDVVVFSSTPVDEKVLEKLAVFGPVRTAATADDEFESAEGVAQRALEGATCDVTPAAWTSALREARFKKKLIAGVSAAVGVWLAIMGVLFGVPFVYGQMTARQKAQSKRHQKAYEEAKSIQDKLKMVQGYSDRAHGALMMLKHMSDNLPDVDGLTLKSFSYKRGDVVSVQGEASSNADVYDYKDALTGLRNDDEDETKMFPGGVVLSGMGKSRGFKIDASMKEPDEADVPTAKPAARRRSR